jgi:hypothetical protein
MKIIEALGFIGSMCVRMFGLLVLIAEAVVPTESKAVWDYIESQREWLNEQQDMLEAMAEVIQNELQR